MTAVFREELACPPTAATVREAINNSRATWIGALVWSRIPAESIELARLAREDDPRHKPLSPCSVSS